MPLFRKERHQDHFIDDAIAAAQSGLASGNVDWARNNVFLLDRLVDPDASRKRRFAYLVLKASLAFRGGDIAAAATLCDEAKPLSSRQDSTMVAMYKELRHHIAQGSTPPTPATPPPLRTRGERPGRFTTPAPSPLPALSDDLLQHLKLPDMRRTAGLPEVDLSVAEWIMSYFYSDPPSNWRAYAGSDHLRMVMDRAAHAQRHAEFDEALRLYADAQRIAEQDQARYLVALGEIHAGIFNCRMSADFMVDLDINRRKWSIRSDLDQEATDQEWFCPHSFHYPACLAHWVILSQIESRDQHLLNDVLAVFKAIRDTRDVPRIVAIAIEYIDLALRFMLEPRAFRAGFETIQNIGHLLSEEALAAILARMEVAASWVYMPFDITADAQRWEQIALWIDEPAERAIAPFIRALAMNPKRPTPVDTGLLEVAADVVSEHGSAWIRSNAALTIATNFSVMGRFADHARVIERNFDASDAMAQPFDGVQAHLWWAASRILIGEYEGTIETIDHWLPVFDEFPERGKTDVFHYRLLRSLAEKALTEEQLADGEPHDGHDRLIYIDDTEPSV